MFLHVSVILFTGGVVSQHALQQVSWGWYPSMPCRFPGPHPGGSLGGFGQGVSRPTPKGEVEGDLARGVSRPTPREGLQAHTCGVYASLHRGNPPTRRLLLWAVHILLECILVVFIFMCFGWYLHISCNQ